MCTKEVNACGDVVNIYSLSGLISVQEDEIEDSGKLACLRDILSGLKYLHKLSRIVVDLKPSNVLLTSNAEKSFLFKLDDFAISTNNRNTVEPLIAATFTAKARWPLLGGGGYSEVYYKYGKAFGTEG